MYSSSERSDLKPIEETKYPGYIISSYLMRDDDNNRHRRALSLKSNIFCRRYRLYSTAVQSCYTCELWANYKRSSIEGLRAQYNNAFHLMFGLPRYCSASSMFTMGQFSSYEDLIRSRVAGTRVSEMILFVM